ncbi:hypothetical protein DITRI_Ditri02bG0173300 [Diplodiscus trichospermus]
MTQNHISTILNHSLFADGSSLQRQITNDKELIQVRDRTDKFRLLLLHAQSVIDEAGERRLLAGISNNWHDVHELDEVLYGTEYVLADLKTQLDKFLIYSSEVSRRKNKNTPFNFLDLRLQLESLFSRLYALTTEVSRSRSRSRSASANIEQPKPSVSVPLLKLPGLDDVRKEIISALLGETSKVGTDNLKIIAIVGMEGIGKTALAQFICNDDHVLEKFEKIVWVSVSEDFDLGRIARAIIQALEGVDHDFLCLLTLAPLQCLLNMIHGHFVDKKTLLVLDDVMKKYPGDDWGDNWRVLKNLFSQGMPESRIILTAREKSAAVAMQSSHIFELKELSDEECWMILHQVAFVGMNRHKDLEDIGKEIAKKCKGLPLAAKVLGGLLQQKTKREEWNSTLNNMVWKSSVAHKHIFKLLWLSYIDLPSAIRRCLFYCVNFPKCFEMSKTLLVQHWMAQGYLNSADDSEMELKGEQYFDCLVARSFFQDFSKCRDDRMQTYKMHSVVHDFLQSLFQCGFRMEIKSVENRGLNFSSVHTLRHLILMIGQGADFPLDLKGVDKLRSLIAVSQGCRITSQALRNLFNQSKHLELLDLSLTSGWHNCFGPRGWGTILHEIPEEICQLMNLKYLNLAGSKAMEILPETLCDLVNLQSLDLTGCTSLSKLPDGIGKLVNLKYLFTWHCSRITCYPKGIGSLTSLREITNVIARVDCNDAEEFSLGDLEKLEHLSGNLLMKLVGNTIDADEASRANLWDKKHLNKIKIYLDGHPREEVVIKALNPSSNLKIEFTAGWS